MFTRQFNWNIKTRTKDKKFVIFRDFKYVACFWTEKYSQFNMCFLCLLFLLFSWNSTEYILARLIMSTWRLFCYKNTITITTNNNIKWRMKYFFFIFPCGTQSLGFRGFYVSSMDLALFCLHCARCAILFCVQHEQPTHYVTITTRRNSADTTDAPEVERVHLKKIVSQLKNNLCNVSVLSEPDLEMITNMDPNSVADITGKDFIEQLKEVSGRLGWGKSNLSWNLSFHWNPATCIWCAESNQIILVHLFTCKSWHILWYTLWTLKAWASFILPKKEAHTQLTKKTKKQTNKQTNKQAHNRRRRITCRNMSRLFNVFAGDAVDVLHYIISLYQICV